MIVKGNKVTIEASDFATGYYLKTPCPNCGKRKLKRSALLKGWYICDGCTRYTSIDAIIERKK